MDKQHKASTGFRLDVWALIQRARQKFASNVEGANLSLPFVVFRIRPLDLEQSVAREIVLRMRDRRVLNARECCDNCIDNALESLQEIRAMLVDQQVALKTVPDGPLALLIEFMLHGIRQFLTYEQRLKDSVPSQIIVPSIPDVRPPADRLAKYQAALETLRAHLANSLLQVCRIADFDPKKLDARLSQSEQWDSDLYVNGDHG